MGQRGFKVTISVYMIAYAFINITFHTGSATASDFIGVFRFNMCCNAAVNKNTNPQFNMSNVADLRILYYYKNNTVIQKIYKIKVSRNL